MFSRIIFILYCEPYVKISYPPFNTKIKNYLNLFATDSKLFTALWSLKMLTLNSHSNFLWSITVTNFFERLKVRIVYKPELSWLFENVHSFNLSHN